jgi:hypothetical protein
MMVAWAGQSLFNMRLSAWSSEPYAEIALIIKWKSTEFDCLVVLDNVHLHPSPR